MKIRKVLAICMALMMLAMVMVACGGGDSGSSAQEAASAGESKPDGASGETASGDEINLKFMGWGDDAEIATFQAMIDQFEAANPGVKVEYITVPAADFDKKMQNMIAANDQPDVFYCSVDYVMKYAATDNLYDLTEFVESNEIFDPENVWDSAIDIYRYDGEKLLDGPIYALPKDVSAFSVVYNKELFDAAGITPPTADAPWDWNDYRDAAIKLTNGDVYGTGMYSLESAVWSNGADWLDSSLSTVTITDPKFTEALQFVADLRCKDGAAPSSTEEESMSSYDRFMQGQLGMLGVGSWSTASLWELDFEWDLMDWPVAPGTGERAVWFGSAGLAVSPTSEHTEAACNLAAFLAFNEDAQRTAYTTGMAVPTLKDMAYGEYKEMENPPANKDAFLNVLDDYGRLATQSRTFNQEWFDEFNSGINAVYDGDMTAQEYCDSMSDQIQQLLDKSIEQQKALNG